MTEVRLTSGQKAWFTRAINHFKKKAKESLTEVEELKKKILVSTNGDTSLNEQFEIAETELEQYRENFKELHEEIFGDEDEESIAEQIREYSDEFEGITTNAKELQERINNYEKKLFGYDVKDEENDIDLEHVNGIKDRIDSYVLNLDNLHKTHTERQVNLFEKIESLLKGASTVALAKAFNEHKESFNTSNKIWMTVFVCSLLLMMGVSIWGFVHTDYQFKYMWKYTLGNLPFLGGAVWLAIYASKQRSQNKRLQQEYAFKEDVAKIYYGLKQEVEELGDTDLGKKLNEKILGIIMDVVSENPSLTLESKSHLDKGPVLESLANITKMVKER